MNADGFSLSRRHVLIRGGVAVVGGLAAGCTVAPPPPRTAAIAPPVPQTVVVAASPPTAPVLPPGPVTTANGGTKPVYLPEAGTRDPVAHSLADTLFWTDVFMEHAKFFVMLMPGPALATQRSQAEQFQAAFARHFERARAGGVDQANFASFIQFKRQMQDAQASGRLGSLVWPLFFDHTAREAERFVQRLGQLSRGVVELDRREVRSSR